MHANDPMGLLTFNQRLSALSPLPPMPMATVAPGARLKRVSTEASNLLECARYLDYTGVMLADQKRIGAAQHISAMVKVLLNEIERVAQPSQHLGLLTNRSG